MATTTKKVSVIGTTTSAAPLDSKGSLSIAWTESKTAGTNVFNVDSATTTAALVLTGKSGDVVNIKGYSGDFTASISGAKLSLVSSTQTITVTLAATSKLNLNFTDGVQTVDYTNAKAPVLVNGTHSAALTKVALPVYGVTSHEAAALTDASGHTYATLGAAINAAVSSATSAKFTTVADLVNAYNAYAIPTFSVVAGSDAKEGTSASFTVNLSSAQSAATAVNLVLTPVGGASAADIDLAHVTVPAGFTLVNNVLTFPVGATTATISIPVVNDSIFPETGEGLTVALTAATGSVAKVNTTAASGTVNFIDVAAPATPAAVSIDATNHSATATAGADTFNIAAGNYAATIAGFGSGDKLVFDPNSSQSVTNTSGSDGVIQIAGSLNNQQVVVTLTGVSPTLDNQIFNLDSFTKAFAPAPVVGPSTSTNISATAVSGTGTSGVDTFNIAAGNYSASIAGFGANDKLVFAPGTVETITNTSASDGNITVAGVLNNQLVTIQLTGVSTALDAQVFSVTSFNTAFGAGSLV